MGTVSIYGGRRMLMERTVALLLYSNAYCMLVGVGILIPEDTCTFRL